MELQKLVDLALAAPLTYVKLELGVWCDIAGRLDVRISYIHDTHYVVGCGSDVDAAYSDLVGKLATGDE